MNELTLAWFELGRGKTFTIRANPINQQSSPIRIGRNPTQCDLVLSHPTVLDLHGEIFFNAQKQKFFLRSVQAVTPPVVNKVPLVTGEVMLHEGDYICLGKLPLKITAIELNSGLTKNYLSSPLIGKSDAGFGFESNHVPIFSTKVILGIGIMAIAVVSAIGVYAFNQLPGKKDQTKSTSQLAEVTSTQTKDLKSKITSPESAKSLEKKGSESCVIVKHDESLNVRSSPDGEKTGNLLSPGTKLKVTGKQVGEWLEIQSPVIGWVEKNYTANECNANSQVVGESKTKVNSGAAVNITVEKALEKATNGDIKGAIAIAKKIPQKSDQYSEAVGLISQWEDELAERKRQHDAQGKELMENASAQAEIGDFGAAIEIAKQVKADSAVYQETQKAIGKWQKELDNQSKNSLTNPKKANTITWNCYNNGQLSEQLVLPIGKYPYDDQTYAENNCEKL